MLKYLFYMLKVKVKFFLSTPRWYTGGVEVQFHSFLTLALDVAEWSTSHSGHLTRDKEPQCPLNRRLSGYQSETGQIKKGKK